LLLLAMAAQAATALDALVVALGHLSAPLGWQTAKHLKRHLARWTRGRLRECTESAMLVMIG